MLSRVLGLSVTLNFEFGHHGRQCLLRGQAEKTGEATWGQSDATPLTGPLTRSNTVLKNTRPAGCLRADIATASRQGD